MTPEEYAQRLRAIAKGIAEKRVCFLAATGTMVEMSRRIWDEGKLTDGSKMTYKDDREIWANAKTSPKKPSGKGKPYEDWIVRPESVSENRSRVKRSVNNAVTQLSKAKRRLSKANTIKQREKAQKAVDYWETRGELASQNQDRFKARFGSGARKIKGGYYANYSAYKAGMGRPDMPFELFGHLRKAWYGGALPTPTESGPLKVVIVLDPFNKKKAEGLAKTKGEFLKLTDAEIASHTARVERIYRREVLGQ